MKKIKLFFGLVAAALVAGEAYAVKISGEIEFTGVATFGPSGTNYATATEIVSYTGIEVQNPFLGSPTTGDYEGIADDTAATFKPFVFGSVGNLSTVPAPVLDFWKVEYSGVTYTFDATSLTRNEVVGTTRILEGSGLAKISGSATTYEDTLGTWQISSSGTGNSFSFSSSAAVPDESSTVALLGLGLAGLGAIARRRK